VAGSQLQARMARNGAIMTKLTPEDWGKIYDVCGPFLRDRVSAHIRAAEQSAREEEAKYLANVIEQRFTAEPTRDICKWIRQRHAKPDAAGLKSYEIHNRTPNPVTVTLVDENRVREIVREELRAGWRKAEAP